MCAAAHAPYVQHLDTCSNDPASQGQQPLSKQWMGAKPCGGPPGIPQVGRAGRGKHSQLPSGSFPHSLTHSYSLSFVHSFAHSLTLMTGWKLTPLLLTRV
jgi:hypothetical protein